MLHFPASFLFGTATAATQIEGGCTTSDWYAFAREPGHVRNGDTPVVACDGWNRWREDFSLQRSLGLGAYRMSLEWARIEPRPGEIDHGALDRYREMVGTLRDWSIEPMVTLHHFTLPLWLAREGGVLCPEFPERLARFARVAAGALSDLCRLWITTNEPNVLAAQGYLLGVWPPALRSPSAAIRACYALLEGHVAAYRALKETRIHEVSVGIAHHLRAATAARPRSVADRLATQTITRLFNEAFAIAQCDGTMFGPLDAAFRSRSGFRVAEARGTQDFFGMNYYTRDVVRFSMAHARELFVARTVPDGAERSDLGWEIYPAGLGDLLRSWGRRTGLPVIVTENGVADASDAKRARFIVHHLAEVARAIADGVSVQGYFYWSLLDNFEWAEGYEPRFGLVAMDYATQGRSMRESARAYARIAQERALPD
ncbi:MAG TPA: family 1 glycosylhydrolase [Polyangiaceae bacterium]|nr:family 1 glycosylhydrolase [Polyangiaceae bacterium]